MLIGYARISTQDQNLDFQLAALERAGAEKVFTDTTPGTKPRDRSGRLIWNHGSWDGA